MASTPKKPKYIGELAKALTQRDVIVETLAYGKGWRAELESSALVALLDHYQIEYGDSQRWLKLAISLARDHVPRFQMTTKMRVGRPRKNALRDYMPDKSKTKKPRGAPRKYTLDGDRAMYEVIAFYRRALHAARDGRPLLGKMKDDEIFIRETLEALGGRKITDRAAIEVAVRMHAHRRHESFLRHKKDIPKYQRRLSEIKKLLPKILEN